MAVSLAGVDFTAENVEQAVLQFYQSKATQVCLGCDSVNGSIYGFGFHFEESRSSKISVSKKPYILYSLRT